jgi:hypothetical protein
MLARRKSFDLNPDFRMGLLKKVAKLRLPFAHDRERDRRARGRRADRSFGTGKAARTNDTK